MYYNLLVAYISDKLYNMSEKIKKFEIKKEKSIFFAYIEV